MIYPTRLWTADSSIFRYLSITLLYSSAYCTLLCTDLQSSFKVTKKYTTLHMSLCIASFNCGTVLNDRVLGRCTSGMIGSIVFDTSPQSHLGWSCSQYHISNWPECKYSPCSLPLSDYSILRTWPNKNYCHFSLPWAYLLWPLFPEWNTKFVV